MKRISIALAASLAWTAVCSQGPVAPPPGDLITITSLDIPRYMGTWFEIAKYPNRFQKNCVADTAAEYRLQTGGAVQIINRCRKVNGELDEAAGEARQTGGATPRSCR